MKISELQELLEKAKEEYGDVEIVIKEEYSHANYTSGIKGMGSAWYGNGYGYVPAIYVD